MSITHVVVDHIPSSGHSDAYFALVGALGGALVVGLLGFFGQRFQSRSENERLGRQLSHDLDQRDFEYLRSLLGDGAEALGSVRKAYLRLSPFWALGDDRPNPRRKAAETEQREATSATRHVLDRLRLQLAPDDEIVVAFHDTLLTMDALADHYIDVGRGVPIGNRVKELGDQLGFQMDEFARLARARVGPRSQREATPSS